MWASYGVHFSTFLEQQTNDYHMQKQHARDLALPTVGISDPLYLPLVLIGISLQEEARNVLC